MQLRRGACLICGVPADQHQPCAACDVNHRRGATVAHWRLCSFCEAQPENEEWSREETSKVGAVDDIAGDERRPMLPTLAEVSGRRRARPAPKRARAARLLRNREMRELVHRIDLRGHWRGYYERSRFLSRREIARLAGCSHTYVNRIFREAVVRPKSRR